MSLISLQISQLIPIVLTFLFLRYTNISVVASHSILGKLFAVALIVFYARIDAILGLFVCLFVIYYYQTDYVEGMKDGMEDDPVKESEDTKSLNVLEHGPVDENMESDETKPSKKSETSETPETETKTPEIKDSEPFSNYETSYQTDASMFAETPQHPSPQKQKFTQEHCEHRTLKYKNQPVRPDITEHVFSNISFEDTPCNICEKGCMYNIIPKIEQEELMRPSYR